MQHQSRFLSKLVILTLLANCVAHVQAAIWDEAMCGWGINQTTISPGESFYANYDVSAQRNSDGYVTVNLYFSETPYKGASSQFLGSDQVYLPYQGSFCSSTVTKQYVLPKTHNGSCYGAGTGYILFEAGTDVTSASFTVIPVQKPTISSFSPASGQPGDQIIIQGTGFNSTHTAVYFDGVEAARSIQDSNTLTAQVPTGANTGDITVRYVDAGLQYCLPPNGVSATAFVMTDTYCSSQATNSGYGSIDFVWTSEFMYNVVGSSACPLYTNNTHLAATVDQGQVGKTIYIQLGSCGAADYARLLKVYVDWNQDNDFDDPGEFVLSAPSLNSDVLYNIGLNVPVDATPGRTRMRFIHALYYTGVVDSPNDIYPCGSYPFGETQDYDLFISQTTSGNKRAVVSDTPLLPEEITEDPIFLPNRPSAGQSPSPIKERILLNDQFVPATVSDMMLRKEH